MWATGREVEQQLAITHGERGKLTEAGILRPVGTAGRATLYDADEIGELRRRTPAQVSAPAIAVRLGGPQRTDDEERMRSDPFYREWRGWSASWDKGTQRDAARMWWEVADPGRLHGGALIAVVSHVVVGAWRIVDHHFDEAIGRVAFEVTDSPELRNFSQTTLRLGRGPLIKVW